MLQKLILQFWKQLVKKVQRDFFDKQRRGAAPRRELIFRLYCRGGASPSRRNAADTNRLPLKWVEPIAPVAALTIFRAPSPNAHTNVAALTAQPLAALPPYGCGVPFTGGERHGGWQYLRHKFRGVKLPDLSLRGGRRPTWRPEREARGSALGVQSREGSYDFADGSPVIQSGTARLPRAQSALAMTNRGPVLLSRWPASIGAAAPGWAVPACYMLCAGFFRVNSSAARTARTPPVSLAAMTGPSMAAS